MKIAKIPYLIIISLSTSFLPAQVNGQSKTKAVAFNVQKEKDHYLKNENKQLDNRPKLKRDLRIKRTLEFKEKHHQNIQKAADTQTSFFEGYLRENQSVIEYQVFGSQINLTITNKFSVKTKTISLPEDLPTHIETLQNCLTNYTYAINSPLESYLEFAESASKLYEYLLLPISKEIANDDLVLILDDPLHVIPFEVLLEKKPDLIKKEVVNYKNLDYLIKKRKISYTDSYASLNNKTKANNGGFLGFAPKFQSSPSEKISKTRSFNTLQFNFKELNIIEKLFSYTVALKGEKASEQAFYDLAEEFNVLHFSTHAIFDKINPYASYLVFSNSIDSKNDGHLHINEISRMELSADLAVLAACNTGSAVTINQQGTISLGNAFIQAGCSSIVTSLWLAHDESTSLIMEYFYYYLSKGATKDEALQKAKLKYLKHADLLNLSPFYWANFVVSGNTQPLLTFQPGKERMISWFCVFALLAMGFGFLVINKII